MVGLVCNLMGSVVFILPWKRCWYYKETVLQLSAQTGARFGWSH